MHSLPDYPCYLNGEFTTLPHAKVSVMDRGFIFGDGVYEVVPVYAGRPFQFDRHRARLGRSLAALQIADPLDGTQWQAITAELLARSAATTAAGNLFGSESAPRMVYLQVTRGVALRDHAMPAGIAPTVFAMVSPMKQPTEAARRDGVACVTAEDFRWQKGHIKTTSLLGAVFARQLSADVGATETVMFRDGFLTEASSSNVWLVKDGAVTGPPNDQLVLEGIRYSLLGELCAAVGIPFALRRIARAEVLAADELLLTSATKEVLPITSLDGTPVGKGKPGPVFEKLFTLYQQAKAKG